LPHPALALAQAFCRTIRRGRGVSLLPLSVRQILCEGGYGRVLKHLDDRKIRLKHFAKPAVCPDEQQGMPAQIEKIVVNTDAFYV
jgi:hypothetical protein